MGKWTRRSVLGGVAGAGVGSAFAAFGGGSDGNQQSLHGGTMALDQAFNVAGDLWIGPDSAKGTVDATSGRVYTAVDTQLEYYGDGEEWVKMGIGSADAPVPEAYAESVSTDRIENVADTIVDTTEALQSAFDNLTAGETVCIGRPETPYRTTQWLDIDVDNVTIVGQSQFAENGEPIIKVADNANVGGLRLGWNSPVENIEIRGIGYHGNEVNQDDTVKFCHGIIVEEATNFTIRDCYFTRTHPYHEHSRGGSSISIGASASNYWVLNNLIEDTGDRGIQTAGSNGVVAFNTTKDGFDRGVSCDIFDHDENVRVGNNILVFRNTVMNNAEGSATGFANQSANDNAENIIIRNNWSIGNTRRMFSGSEMQEGDRGIKIVGNVSYQDQRSGVQVAPGDPNFGGLEITDNIIIEPVNAGVRLFADVNNCEIKRNTILSPGGGGILVRGESIIKDNTIENTGAVSINLDQDAPESVIVDNTIEGGPKGIEVKNGSSETYLQGNNIKDVSGRAIVIDEPGCQAYDNQILRCNNPIVNAAGDDTDIRHDGRAYQDWVVDSSAQRVRINGWSTNNGDPSEQGDWNGSGREGVNVYDTLNDVKYSYVDDDWR